MRRKTLLTSLITVILGALLTPPTVAFADDDAPAVSWSVEPASADGAADGRSWVEQTLDPGASVQQWMLITNRSDQTVHFALSAADGYFTDTGRFNMLPAGQASTDAGTWISIPDAIDIPARQSATVPFTITVPTNATPGDHPAGVAAGVLSTGDAVGVESRIGFRVMTRVTGELNPTFTTRITALYHPSWNPFLPGQLEVTLTTSNTGNERLSADSTLTTTGPANLNKTSTSFPPLTELAPGESRDTRVTMENVWPLFATTATAVTTPATVDSAKLQPITAAATVPTVPWSQLLAAALVIALLTLVQLDKRRRRRNWRRRIDAAREEGRRERLTPTLAVTALLIAASCLTATAYASPAIAQSDISIQVDITPAPSPSTPDSSHTAPPSHGLAITGREFDSWGTAAGALALLLGVAAVTISRTRITSTRTPQRVTNPTSPTTGLRLRG